MIASAAASKIFDWTAKVAPVSASASARQRNVAATQENFHSFNPTIPRWLYTVAITISVSHSWLPKKRPKAVYENESWSMTVCCARAACPKRMWPHRSGSVNWPASAIAIISNSSAGALYSNDTWRDACADVAGASALPGRDWPATRSASENPQNALSGPVLTAPQDNTYTCVSQ